MRLAASLLLTALLSSAPLSGLAASPAAEANAEVKVSFHDLNLQDPADAKRLLVRIQNAALDACGASPESVPEYRALTVKSECYSDGVRSAVSRIGSPTLSAVYNEDPSTRLASR